MSISIINTKEKGRCFFTTRDISKGEIVFIAEPFARIVDQSSKTRACNSCVTEPESSTNAMQYSCLIKCGAHYCSTECVGMDKRVHSLMCSFTPKSEQLGSYARDYLELLMLVLCRMNLEPEHAHIEMIEGMWFDIAFQSASQIKEYTAVSLELVRFLAEKLPDFKVPPVQDAFHEQLAYLVGVDYGRTFSYLYSLVSKEECNSFGLYTYSYQGPTKHRQGFGLALFPSAVYFNHSCDPNIGRAYNKDGNMEFFAVKDIKRGQEALITYIELDLPVGKRKERLQDHFHFDCSCERCIAENDLAHYRWSSKLVICGKNGCLGSFRPAQSLLEWNCIACGHLIREMV